MRPRPDVNRKNGQVTRDTCQYSKLKLENLNQPPEILTGRGDGKSDSKMRQIVDTAKDPAEGTWRDSNSDGPPGRRTCATFM